ncbi:MAG: helix-turn-helix domain-containing protein [Nanoarchaeota archaeon]|nr:helix-turn-helix domain-containing protein [Nanoarchaeota archaeon]
MESNMLVQFGLTEGESKVYLALIKLGKSTIGNIIKEANVSNSKIYNILDRLNKKGFVGVVIENNKRSFEAKNPENLMEMIKDKEKEIQDNKKKLKNILPSLKGIFESHEVKQEAEILKGEKGIKTFLERLLRNTGSTKIIYIIGAPREANERMNAYLLEWHKKRIVKKIKCRILYNSDAKKWAEKRTKMRLTEIRYLPKNIKTPIAIDFNGQEVGTINYGIDPFCFSVTNIQIAKNYEIYFKLLWELGR